MTEFQYVNPHSWLYVVVTDDKGEETLWGIEAEGPSALMRAGIKQNALQPGDMVTVTARPLRDGRPAGAWVSVTKADGTVLAPARSWSVFPFRRIERGNGDRLDGASRPLALSGFERDFVRAVPSEPPGTFRSLPLACN